MHRRAIVSLALAVGVSACGGTSFSDQVVAVEAAWLCDVPRFAYADAHEVDDALSALLDEAGVSKSTYVAFKDQLDGDAELRRRVGEHFDAMCGGG